MSFLLQNQKSELSSMLRGKGDLRKIVLILLNLEKNESYPVRMAQILSETHPSTILRRLDKLTPLLDKDKHLRLENNKTEYSLKEDISTFVFLARTFSDDFETFVSSRYFSTCFPTHFKKIFDKGFKHIRKLNPPNEEELKIIEFILYISPTAFKLFFDLYENSARGIWWGSSTLVCRELRPDFRNLLDDGLVRKEHVRSMLELIIERNLDSEQCEDIEDAVEMIDEAKDSLRHFMDLSLKQESIVKSKRSSELTNILMCAMVLDYLAPSARTRNIVDNLFNERRIEEAISDNNFCELREQIKEQNKAYREDLKVAKKMAAQGGIIS